MGNKTQLDADSKNVSKSSDGQTQSRREELFDMASGAADLTLAVLRDVASFAPIPFLGLAATLAIEIWGSVQATRSGKSALTSLGKDACTLVFTVSTTCDEVLQRRQSPKQSGEKENEEEKLNPQLESNLKKLCDTLEEINKFTSHTVSRNVVKRFLTSKLDASKVADYQGRLKTALDTFTLQANITNQQVLSRVETQIKLMQTQLSASEPRPLSSASGGVPHSVIGIPDPLNAASPQPSDTKITEVAQAPTEGGIARAEAGIGAQAFPAIFSFAGATLRTGGTIITNRKTSTPLSCESRPKSSEYLAEINRNGTHPVVAREASDQSTGKGKENRDSDDASSPRARLAGSETAEGGSITFNAITGGQNITRINDSSQKSNFGNVYNVKGGHTLGQQNTGVNQALGRDDGVRGNSERSYDVPRTGNDDWPGDAQDGRHFGYSSYGSHTAPIHRIEHVPRSTYYDENGVLTAIPRQRWYNRAQGEDEEYSERNYDVGGRSWRSSGNPSTEETEMHAGGRGTSDWGTWDAQRSFHVPQWPKARSAYHNESSIPAALRQGPNRSYWRNSNRV